MGYYRDITRVQHGLFGKVYCMDTIDLHSILPTPRFSARHPSILVRIESVTT